MNIRLRAAAGDLMSGYRRIAIDVNDDDGHRVAGDALFDWADIPRRERMAMMRRDLPIEVGGHGDAQLCVNSFDAATTWLAERGIGTAGWAHTGHGTWVPADHPDAAGRPTGQPCANRECGLPAKAGSDHPELCGRHAAGQRRSAQAAAQLRARMDATAERAAERTRRRRAAADWAQRLRDEYHLDARPGADGGVELSGEGLHALFALLDAELGAEVRAELTPHELRARPSA